MPVSIVVGGQYGSEGKGKVALELVRRDPSTTIVVRPGGTNSGHTGYSRDGRRFVLRQLPAAAIDGTVKVVLPAGSYIEVDLLQREIEAIGLPPSQLHIDPRAQIIRPEHMAWEAEANLVQSIGSTNSGTGAAVIARAARYAPQFPMGIQAADLPVLAPYISDVSALMASTLQAGDRVLIEGTQGFGLSVLHSDAWPKCTSRDTTAASFLSEAGLSPRSVDRIILVLRCHPIRVAGDSGPLIQETTWEDVAANAGTERELREYTSVTHKLRRVGHFDVNLVKRAIAANLPTDIVLNHIDYVDASVYDETKLSRPANEFIQKLERDIGGAVNFIGTSETRLFEHASVMA